MPAPRPPLPLTGLPLLGAYAFTLVGAYQSMFGPAFPRLLQEFQVSQATVGWITSLTFLGSTLAILASTRLLERFGPRRFLGVAAVLLSGGLLGLGLAPGWGAALVMSFIAGVGAGCFSSGVNTTLARKGQAAAGTLNVVNAMYCLGSVIGPLIIGLTPGVPVMWPFAWIALLSLPLLLGLRGLPGPLPAQPTPRVAGARRGVALFSALLFVYVMTESGAANWLATHLAPTLGVAQAAMITSLFWLALVLGRFAIAPLTGRLAPGVTVPAAAALAVLAALLANVEAARVPAYLLLGLALAPIFPTTLAWFGQHLPARLAPLAMTGGALGATAVQPIIGNAVGFAGVSAIPLAVSIFAVIMLAVAVWLRASNARASGPASSDARLKAHPGQSGD